MDREEFRALAIIWGFVGYHHINSHPMKIQDEIEAAHADAEALTNYCYGEKGKKAKSA